MRAISSTCRHLRTTVSYESNAIVSSSRRHAAGTETAYSSICSRVQSVRSTRSTVRVHTSRTKKDQSSAPQSRYGVVYTGRGRKVSSCASLLSPLRSYIRSTVQSDVLWSCVGSFTTILLASRLDAALPTHVANVSGVKAPFVIGTLGTLGVGLFAMEGARVMRLKNVVFGHILSAAVVIVVIQLLGITSLSKALAFSIALGIMMKTDTIHPPGGGIIVVFCNNNDIRSLGYWFLLYPGNVNELILHKLS